MNKSKPFSIKASLNKEVSQQKLKIQGLVPEWIKGTFIRNGPISISINNQKVPHWFDGPAMLHGFTFEKGNILYTNKFLKTNALKTVYNKGTFNYLGFATLPRHPWLKRIIQFFSSKECLPIQNANVNVAKVSNQYLAYTETPLQVCFDLKTLDTLGTVYLQDHLPKANVFESAHPHVDGKTGEQFNYMVDYGFKSHYIIYRYQASSPMAYPASCPKRSVLARVSVKNPAYMHSFGVSEHYIILVEFPFVVNPLNLLFMKKPFIKNYYWDPKRGTRFLIIQRSTGKVVTQLTYPHAFFAFHHVNAFEKNDNLILDMVTYPNADVIFNLSEHGYLSDSPKDNFDEGLHQTKLSRFIISLEEKQIRSEVLFDKSFEFPRINEQYSAHSYRFVYGSDVRPLSKPEDLRPIYKIDIPTKTILSWHEPGAIPGEPIFIPHSNVDGEDQGVIVTIVLDPVHEKSFLLWLDAKTLKELGRAYTPFAIPVGLHGEFFKLKV